MNHSSLFLLHGAMGASSQFYPLIPLLKDKYTVHTLDFEGHGISRVRSRPFRVEHFSENVVDYMNDHAIDSTYIFGHSMGGHVGLYLARFSPDRIKRVFTLGTKFLWTPEIAERENSLLDPDKIRKKVPKFAKELQERHVASGWETVLEKFKEFHICLGHSNPLKNEDIQKIEKKVRIGLGDRDKMVSIEETVELYRLLKDGEMQVLPGTPHPIEKVPIEILSNSIIDFFN